MRKASLKDVDRLVELMAEFYAEGGFPLNRKRAVEAFTGLLTDENRGHIWLIQSGSEDVGHIVITLGYSMEYGGLNAFVDDLFVRAPFRGAGLARSALEEVTAFCVRLSVRALHVETGRENVAAQAVYRRLGFAETDRQLLTLRLADPTHVS